MHAAHVSSNLYPIRYARDRVALRGDVTIVTVVTLVTLDRVATDDDDTPLRCFAATRPNVTNATLRSEDSNVTHDSHNMQNLYPIQRAKSANS